ncbi:MAG: hypothetical protein ABII64_08440 [Elusimicrobiota bacterium]
MRFFSVIKSSFTITFLAIGAVSLSVIPLHADSPRMHISTAEITMDGFDSGGDPADGYTGDDYALRYALGEPGGITKLSGANYVLQSGYFGQDLVAPANVSAIWHVPGGLARSITLQWRAPGDNERDDINLWGSRIHISTATDETSAENDSFWTSKRDEADFQISTAGVDAQAICSYRITGLVANVTYYFRMWNLDQAANWSDISTGGTTYARPVILSVYVVEPTTFNFGWQQTGISTVAANGIVVRNDGNTTETYLMRLTTGTIFPSDTVWDAGTEPGNNVFSLYSILNATAPQVENFGLVEGDDLLMLDDNTCSDTNYSMGYEKGDAVVPYMVSPLLSDNTCWFMLKTPLATSTTADQVITVIFTATETP